MEEAAAAQNPSLDILPKVADAAEWSRNGRAAVLMFVFQSGALAALFSIVLWCSRGDTLHAVYTYVPW